MKLSSKRTGILSAVLAALLVLLCGCSSAPAAGSWQKAASSASPAAPASAASPAASSPAASSASSPAAASSSVPGAAGPDASAPTEPDDAIYVSTTEELFNAIAPGAHIVIEPGYRNMSLWLEHELPYRDTPWSSPYVRLEECYDGTTVIIKNVDGLSISGGSQNRALTELVVEPRYADVLAFEDCTGVTLSNLTLGHTMSGECSGAVVRLEDCADVRFENVDLYGCGVIGIEAEDVNGLTVRDSVVRDCSDRAMFLNDCKGALVFEDSLFTGCPGGFTFFGTDTSAAVFRRCRFGDSEGNDLFYYDEIATEDCYWPEIYEYPDFGDLDDDDAFRELLRGITFPADLLKDTTWSAFLIGWPAPAVDQRPEQDAITLSFGDGTAVLTGLYDYTVNLTWEVDSSGNAQLLENGEYFGTLQVYVPADSDEPIFWLELRPGGGETSIWF